VAEIKTVSGQIFSRIPLLCPQCRTLYKKEDRLPAFEAQNGMWDIYCPECEKFNARSEARVEKGEITRKHKDYIRRQKLTRISRLPDEDVDSE